MKYQPVSYLLAAVLLAAPNLPVTAGDVTGGERDQEEGGGSSAAVYHLEEDQASFEITVANEFGSGNKLVDIEVLTTAGPSTSFSGVFYPVTGTVHTLIHGDLAEWNAFLTLVEPLDGRWLDLEVGYHLGNTRFFSAIFLEDGDNYGYLVDSDMTDSGLQSNMEAQLRAGRSMVDFEAYNVSGSNETRFAAIWVSDPNQPMTHLYYDLEIDDVDDLWTPLAGRVIDFERYHSSFFGEERFALVVANIPGGEWYADTNMTLAQLNTTNTNVSDLDTHLIDLHVFRNGSEARFSGIWGKDWKSLNEVAAMPSDNPVPLTSELNTLINDFEVTSPNGEGIVGFYAKNLRTNESVGYRANEPFYLGSATKTAAHIRLWMQIQSNHFTLDQNTEMQYSVSVDNGKPWYVDERPKPGFSTGTPKYKYCSGGNNDGDSCSVDGDCDSNMCVPQNNLGQSFPLNQFDQAMMWKSDNGATSALIDHSTLGLAHDSTNLNEWLSSIDGVGKGWGVVTSIQDLDRLIHWHGQHNNSYKNDPSYFLAPGHTFGTRGRNTYRACTVNDVTPVICVPASTCDRCDEDADCNAGETCEQIKDPWASLRNFFLLTGTDPIPGVDYTDGRERYYAMGVNSATPRAYANLLEKFWNHEFTLDPSPDSDVLLDNMLKSSQLDDDFPCRLDWDGDTNCDPGEGFTIKAVKEGSKGSASDDTAICVTSGIVEMRGGGGGDDFTMTVMTRKNGIRCVNDGSDNDIRDHWWGPFGLEMLRALATDLEAGGTIPPTYVLNSGQYEVTLSVDNVGGATSGDFKVRLFASDIFDGTGVDLTLDTIDISSLAGFSGTGTNLIPLIVPASLPLGEYWVFADVDSGGVVPELDETDSSNISRLTGGKLYVVPPCPDDDGDGWSTCSPLCIPVGTDCGDCVPDDPTIYPGAVEICDGIDQDCDTIIDNNIPTPLVTKRVEHDDPLPFDHFGESMANVGDLNGDTIDDFVIGMTGEDVAGVSGAGLARVISGADLSTICDAVLPTPTISDGLGESVAAAAGDLNNNGQPDFVVGIPFYDGAATNTGAVAAFNGPDCAFIRMMEDPAMVGSDRLGVSVVSIGDINNDTVPDIAAGSIRSNLSGTPGGAISVFSGATGNVLFTMFDPAATADDLGWALAGPGDMSGDGVPDIAAGAPRTDTTGISNGAVYIFSGANGSLYDVFTDPTGESYADLGESLVSLGDLGSDGISELAAGQNGDIVGGVLLGSVAIFEGSSGVVVQRLVNPSGMSGEYFGSAVAPIADMSGDGKTDVLVGARLDDDLGPNTGSVFIFDSVTGAMLHHILDPDGSDTDELGTHVISLGDISGDGVPDFAASGPRADNIEGREAGHVIVFVLEEDCDNDGFSPYAGDCNDSDPLIRPNANDICDMVDNDCDGLTDEDSDGDGFDVCNDCNDRNPLVNPNGIEVCNQIDDNCSGISDEDPDGTDDDGDGNFGACSDCDDTNPAINWNAPDTCNHIDDDCDGIPDQDYPMVVSTRFSMLPSGEDNDELATDVAAIGDVNNDGVDDFVAGIPLADISGTNQGAAVVFDGATGATICVATPGTQNSEQSGVSVAGVGDLNGDGAADFVMGAPFHNTNVSYEGKVYVINGDDCTLIRELVDSNAMTGDRLGISVTGIGDLTGDGIREIAAGASWAQTPLGNDAGAVLVWNGATGAELFKLTDPHTGNNHVGESVAGVEDVNADGVPDIVAGAPFDDGVLGGDVGSLLVFSGADGSIIHKIFDPDGTGSDRLGTSVAGIADLTGDHVPDILAGAPREDSGGADNGAILVFSGADGTLAQRVPLTDVSTGLHFGVSVAALNDLNGDLIPEFAGGAADDDTEGQNAGRIVVFNGADFSVLYDLTLPGSSPDSNLGFALDGIGDLNGDGTPEIIVAQPRQHTQEDFDVGRVVVYSFESDCDSDGVGPFEGDCDDQSGLRYPGLIEFCDGIDNDCDSLIDEDEDGDGDDACADCVPDDPTISTSMIEVCNMVDDDCNMQIDEGVDLDGDTYTTPCDCDDGDANVNVSIIEACNTIDDNCDGQIDEGFATPLDQVRIVDPAPTVGDDAGTSIAVIGDVDSDGAQDIVIGMPGEDTAINGGGSAIVISGATRSMICRLLDPNAMTSDAMGGSVAGIGDVTGDGTPDIAVGVIHDDWAGASSGAVQIFDGATCAWVRELTDPGAEAADYFGASIASIGDVTGDTVPDIAVGSNFDHENGYSNNGSVSVFNGATGAFLYKATDPHGRDNDQLGISVSPLGDVDFDGIPDFIAGAWVDDVYPRGSAGSVTVFSGVDGSFIRSIVDPMRVGNGFVGRSVAAAGDMNGDGFPDLITGTEGDDTGGTNAGAVLAFSGLDGSLIRRYVDSSPLTSAHLGASVTAAGDLNGDGITEVVAGAPNSSRTGSSAGEVVLFDGATGAVLHRFTDVSSLAGDDLGFNVLAADITGGGGVDILAGAPDGDPGGISQAGYVTVFTLDADCDGDGYSPLADCDDTDGGTTGAPGPATSLLFSDKTTMQWTAPADPGLSPGTLVYDVVRSDDPSDFMTAPTCVESDDGADTAATDTDTPAPGALFAYLVRVETRCGVAADPGRSVAQCP